MPDYSEVLTELEKSMKVLRESLPKRDWDDSSAAFLHMMAWAGKGFDFVKARQEKEIASI